MHLNDLPQLKEPGMKTRRLHSGSRTHRVKIRGALEQKFLCVATSSEAPVAPVLYRGYKYGAVPRLLSPITSTVTVLCAFV